MTDAEAAELHMQIPAMHAVRQLREDWDALSLGQVKDLVRAAHPNDDDPKHLSGIGHAICLDKMHEVMAAKAFGGAQPY